MWQQRFKGKPISCAHIVLHSVENIWEISLRLPRVFDQLKYWVNSRLLRGFQSQEVPRVSTSSRLLHSLKVYFFSFLFKWPPKEQNFCLFRYHSLFGFCHLHGIMKSDVILFVKVKIISNDYYMHKPDKHT